MKLKLILKQLNIWSKWYKVNVLHESNFVTKII